MLGFLTSVDHADRSHRAPWGLIQWFEGGVLVEKEGTGYYLPADEVNRRYQGTSSEL